jgi:hypothetical protein
MSKQPVDTMKAEIDGLVNEVTPEQYRVIVKLLRFYKSTLLEQVKTATIEQIYSMNGNVNVKGFDAIEWLEVRNKNNRIMIEEKKDKMKMVSTTNWLKTTEKLRGLC